MEFFDIHCHFLPGVDDGPASLDETVEVLRVAHAGGTRSVAATPHMFLDLFGNQDAEWMQTHFDRTCADLARRSERNGCQFLSEMRLFAGAENFVSSGFFDRLAQRRLLTLGGSRYLLVEFPSQFPKTHYMPALRRILEAGYVPVLAHIERYQACQQDHGLIGAFLEAGCLTQVNASSVTVSFWARQRRMLWDWLRRDLISVIASDGHGHQQRLPLLADAHRKLLSAFPANKVAAWFTSNPRWILSSPPLNADIPLGT